MTEKEIRGEGPRSGEPSELSLESEPLTLFEAWLAEATISEINDPNGMALATADASGMPNVRMVLLKGLDGPDVKDRGFVFYTNLESAKGRELEANPQAALLFHWKSLRRQVRVRGVVTPVSPDEADAYFATRPRLSRIGAWASDQSRQLESRFALEKKVAQFTAHFGVSEVTRPPHWSGFRVRPQEIEFWQDKPFRLHDRLVFRRTQGNEGWTTSKLYP